MDTLTRDAYMEAVLGARLHFHAQDIAVTRGPQQDYWAGVYKRWAQLYAGDRWRKVMDSVRDVALEDLNKEARA